MGEVDEGAARDGGVDCGAARDGGADHGAASQGWGHKAAKDEARVQHCHAGEGRGMQVRCLRRTALHSCARED
jgi:hypothetical protein